MKVQEPDTRARSFGQKYKADDYADYYSKKHEASLGRRLSNLAERRMIRRCLGRIQRRQSFHSILDCPSGTGRFLPTLCGFASSVITMDTSDAMLREGRRHFDLFASPPNAAAGSAFELPLADDAVDVALCSRLLHHIPEPDRRVKILSELARVARVGVVVSFFDAASYRAWKRRRKTQRTRRPSGRHAVDRSTCRDEARSAGLKLIGMNALLRFHTEVTAAAFIL